MQSIIIVALVLHLIGDFYLQTDNISNLKHQNIKYLLLHAVFYSLPFLLVFIQVRGFHKLLLYFMVLTLSHMIIDYLKGQFHEKYGKDKLGFLVDQLLHISIAILMVYTVKTNYVYTFPYFLNDLVSYILLHLNKILMVLLLLKPCNIIFLKYFSKYKPNDLDQVSEENRMPSIQGAGATIGNLERILVIILLYTGNIGLIGFVLGIKSLARFEMISKNRVLSEYYIIGTLYSYIYTFIVFLTLK